MIKTLQKITNRKYKDTKITSGIKKTVNKTRKLILINNNIDIKNKKIAKRNTKKVIGNTKITMKKRK